MGRNSGHSARHAVLIRPDRQVARVRMTVRTPDVTEEALRRWVDPAISATDSRSKHGAIVGVSAKPHNGFKATCSPND